MQMPVSVPLCLKATPKMEGGERWIYCEPSNESTDIDNERVLREALRDSADYFLAKGNLDIEHLTLVGLSRVPPIDNPRLYEIGRPTDVRFTTVGTFVKGRIYQGAGKVAEQANQFWDSLTTLDPPMPWYPSVGGHVREKGLIIPAGETQPVKAIRKVYWNNIGFSREPVNHSVPGVTTVPLPAFAKCWVGASEPATKSVAAGYGTDSAAITGGAALRHESLQGGLTRYQTLVTALVRGMKSGTLRPPLTRDALVEYLMQTAGVSQDDAEAVVSQFEQARLSTIKQRRSS